MYIKGLILMGITKITNSSLAIYLATVYLASQTHFRMIASRPRPRFSCCSALHNLPPLKTRQRCHTEKLRHFLPVNSKQFHVVIAKFSLIAILIRRYCFFYMYTFLPVISTYSTFC